MKYIRTKDGSIIKWNDGILIDNDIQQGESYKSCNGVYYLSKADIVKQANTIEELCDYVVSMNELCDVPIVEELPHEMGNDKHFISNAKFQILQGQHGEWWVKLAITTDKGLIYVAKMNEKGELELL